MRDATRPTGSLASALASSVLSASLKQQASPAHDHNDATPAVLFDPATTTNTPDNTAATAVHPSDLLPRNHRRAWITPTDNDLAALVDTIGSLVQQGHGECLITVGLDETSGNLLELVDDDFESCWKTLDSVAERLHAKASLLCKRKKDGHLVIEALVRRQVSGHVEQALEIRVACVGNVDAGKSTVLGVLTSGRLDDGRGLARVALFKHKHEVETGRTSCVGHEIMGFDTAGQALIHPTRKLDMETISQNASKIISFLDLAGHEKYLKTTVFGMTGCAPDYVMLIIGANAGIIGMTKEHLGLALALNVPVYVVITKVDMCPPNVLETTVKHLTKILKSSGCRKIPLFVQSDEDVVMCSKNFVSESNVTGTGLNFLRQFLNILPLYKPFDTSSPVMYEIVDIFSVPGVGTVVSGTVLSGIVHAGDTLLLGPDGVGQFNQAVVKSIHRKRTNVATVQAGQSATFALKRIKRSALRKGMVLAGKDLQPRSCWEFEADILILYHSSTITTRYETMMHCGNIRQTVRIVRIECQAASAGQPTEDVSADAANESQQVIRTGDRGTVRFRFVLRPEFVQVGRRLLFREGRTKGVGQVTRVFYD